jgi:hypothetical protein
MASVIETSIAQEQSAGGTARASAREVLREAQTDRSDWSAMAERLTRRLAYVSCAAMREDRRQPERGLER